MPKLSNKKLCADSECSHPILIARALQDYYPGDCRFIPIQQGQLVYVYAMLKDRGNLFWAGSVQNTYYGEQEARIGHFPSSVVEETHALMPATTEVKTTVSEPTVLCIFTNKLNYYQAVSILFLYFHCFHFFFLPRTGISTATDAERTHRENNNMEQLSLTHNYGLIHVSLSLNTFLKIMK
ncbi:melanoma-derived growth regulatory protein isoform X2 [Poecilia formosa]|nr:PREDICTED: melanoma-derived growth regulatory protein isoform X2 [Poecilia formosa]